MEMFLQLIVSGLANGAIYALIALTICIVFKGTDVTNFATGELAMMGAFVAFTCVIIWGWPIYLAVVMVGLIFPVLLGFSIERFAERPLIPAGHLPMVMGTMALQFGLRGLARLIWGGDIKAIPALFGSEPFSMTLGTITLVMSRENLVMLLFSPVIMVVFFLFFQLTKLGKMMRASQENPLGASIVGIDILKMFSFTWIIGCVLACWAALLFAPISLVYVEIGAKVMIKGFAATILGGFGVIPGAIIGGLMMGVIEVLFAGYVTTTMADLSSLLVIFLVMVMRPTGLMGKRKIEKL
jgi:branched-chain amino acid transport system permease protein